MKTTWLEMACGAIVATALACGGGAEDPAGEADSGGGGGGGGSGGADGGTDPTCPASQPICSAFVNTGSAGGHVEVSLMAGDDAAIVRTNSLSDYPTTDFGDNPNDALPQQL